MERLNHISIYVCFLFVFLGSSFVFRGQGQGVVAVRGVPQPPWTT